MNTPDARSNLPQEAGRLEGMAMMVERDSYDPRKLAAELRNLAARLHPDIVQTPDAKRAAMAGPVRGQMGANRPPVNPAQARIGATLTSRRD